jgi:formate/nitrite transporter
LALLVYFSGHWQMSNGAVGVQMIKIAAAKASLTFWEAFFKGILCNILVCLAVWTALAGRSVTDKIFAILLPVSAFVAAGFEHSVANMYFLPLGILVQGYFPLTGLPVLTWFDLLCNLIPVTLGNIAGGGVMVAIVYYLIYRDRGSDELSRKSPPS